MTNEQIHDYLRSKRAVKKFAEFCNITEQGLLYRLKKGKKSVAYELLSYIHKTEGIRFIDACEKPIERISCTSVIFSDSDNIKKYKDILKGNKNDN